MPYLKPLRRITRLLPLLALPLLAACAQYSDRRGVEVSWDESTLASFDVGTTTRNEVLTTLGPPSQVISLGEETVLYYLFERSEGQALILIVFNKLDVDTRYDRAVFFFNDDDVLTEYSARNPIDAG